MYIIIKEKTVKVGAAILNGEEVIVDLQEIRGSFLNFKTHAASDLELTNPLNFVGVGNMLTTEAQNIYVAGKELVSFIKLQYGLQDSDLVIKSELVWRHPERTIRLYIPTKHIINTPMYAAYISNIKDAGTPYYELKDGYVIYLEEVYSEFQEVLNTDTNILIELL